MAVYCVDLSEIDNWSGFSPEKILESPISMTGNSHKMWSLANVEESLCNLDDLNPR